MQRQKYVFIRYFKRFWRKKKNFRKNVWRIEKSCIFAAANKGALAQLARALAWHARGHRFDSVMLHKRKPATFQRVFLFMVDTVDGLSPIFHYNLLYSIAVLYRAATFAENIQR